MKRGTGTDNIQTIILLKELRKTKSPAWKRVKELLERPTRKRAEITVKRLGQIAKDGETLAVAGKVMGSGKTGKFTVGAFAFTKGAEKSLKENGCKMMSLNALVKANPKGSKIRIII